MVLFIMLYGVVLTSESVDEILKCKHLNESYCVRGGSNLCRSSFKARFE